MTVSKRWGIEFGGGWAITVCINLVPWWREHMISAVFGKIQCMVRTCSSPSPDFTQFFWGRRHFLKVCQHVYPTGSSDWLQFLDWSESPLLLLSNLFWIRKCTQYFHGVGVVDENRGRTYNARNMLNWFFLHSFSAPTYTIWKEWNNTEIRQIFYMHSSSCGEVETWPQM